MSANVLTPVQAAEIAQQVYRVQKKTIKQLQEKGSHLGLRSSHATQRNETFSTNLKTDDNEPFEVRLKATTGLHNIRLTQTTGFGYIAEGEGKFQGETLIAVRGTDGIADLLTDINAGVSISGNKHVGFKATFDSFKGELDDYFKKVNRNPSQVHLVGHSLGGAVATLAADHIKQGQAIPTKLYTFGCPRVGTKSFAAEFTHSMGPDNIFRVHHANDPVTMIPIWPFYHVPKLHENDRNPGFWLNGGSLIRVFYHLMDSYTPLMKSFESWDSINAMALNESTKPSDLSKFLDMVSSGQMNITMFSSFAFNMITKCLAWLIKEAQKVTLGMLATAGTATSSALDLLAIMLHKAAVTSASIASRVKKLMVAIFRFLGRTVQSVGEITVAFIRWTLDLLGSAIQAMVRLALAFPQGK